MSEVLETLRYLPNTIKLFPWLRVELSRGGDHPLASIIRFSDVTGGGDSSYQNTDLVDLDNDLAELMGTPGLSKLALSMKDKDSYFDHRACLWFAAKYKRAGYDIEFIPEVSGKKTPDMLLRDSTTGLAAILEVKHVSLITSMLPMIEEIRAVPSTFSVRLTINVELPYSNQAENVARIVTDKLRSISLNDENAVSYQFLIPGIGEFELIRNREGKKEMTGVMITSPRVISVPKICERLSQLIDKARTQLTSHSPGGINVICLYVEDLTIKPDIAELTLSKEPGLFGFPDYMNVAAVKYVRQMVGHEERLFMNAHNAHVKTGEIVRLRL